MKYEENLCPYKMTDVRRWGRLGTGNFSLEKGVSSYLTLI